MKFKGFGETLRENSPRIGGTGTGNKEPVAVRTTGMSDPIHSERTRKHGYRYQFTGKHHGAGKADDARWAKDVTREEEFSVFDEADFHDISDEDGRFYGVLRKEDGTLRDLGTWQQQIAEFPPAKEGVPRQTDPGSGCVQRARSSRRWSVRG